MLVPPKEPESLTSHYSDFADDFPDTEVIGTDISLIQPSWVPPNLKLYVTDPVATKSNAPEANRFFPRSEIEDCTQEWTFPDNSFDYVHMRWLNGSIDDWAKLFKEAYRCCKPGGYIESFEGAPYMESDDGTVKDTDALGQWGKVFVEGGRRFGRSFTTVPDGTQRKAIQEAGFVDNEEKDLKVRILAFSPLAPVTEETNHRLRSADGLKIQWKKMSEGAYMSFESQLANSLMTSDKFVIDSHRSP